MNETLFVLKTAEIELPDCGQRVRVRQLALDHTLDFAAIDPVDAKTRFYFTLQHGLIDEAGKAIFTEETKQKIGEMSPRDVLAIFQKVHQLTDNPGSVEERVKN